MFDHSPYLKILYILLRFALFISKESSNTTYSFAYLKKYFEYGEWLNIIQKI
jgi:hypothetical protein